MEDIQPSQTQLQKHDAMQRILASLVLALIWVVVSARSSDVDFDLIEWVSSNKDGYVNPKVEFRILQGSLGEPVVGIFSTTEIAQGQVITQIPWEMIIKSSDRQRTDRGTFCKLVRTLAKEFKFGNRSKYAPYVMHLLSLREGQIPSGWSDEGKYMILELLGGEDQQLPPGSITQIIDYEWVHACGGDIDDDVAMKAAEIVIQREDQGLMVPLYDLLEHRNGNYTNTKTRLKEGIYHQTIATRTIHAGEQLYKSHDLCEECNKDAVKQGYGTAGKELYSRYTPYFQMIIFSC